ncbi:MAG: tagF [Belnapia sp.]|nr:tagF [Belnapia sp.]
MPGAGALSPPPLVGPSVGLLVGLFGKLPAHGDFVRRGLPGSFCEPWDAWLQAGIAAARDRLGAGWEAAWDAAPAWRFALPAGACGPDPVAGVLAPSADAVGRRFALTGAAVLPGATEAAWPAPWFAAMEGALRAAQAGGLDADALAALLPLPGTAEPAEAPAPGWWTAPSWAAGEPGLVWPLPSLPEPSEFILLLDAPA